MVKEFKLIPEVHLPDCLPDRLPDHLPDHLPDYLCCCCAPLCSCGRPCLIVPDRAGPCPTVRVCAQQIIKTPIRRVGTRALAIYIVLARFRNQLRTWTMLARSLQMVSFVTCILV